MARAKSDLKPARPPRKGRGFRRASDTARKVVDSIAGKQGFAEADVLLNWPQIVGEALADTCTPVKVQYGADRALGAVLVVRTTGAMAPQVEHMGPQIVERVNQHYGYRAVRRMRVTQSTGMRGTTPGFAEAATPFGGKPKATGAQSAPDPLPAETREAAEMTKEIQSPGLRAALERMGAHVLAQDRRGS